MSRLIRRSGRKEQLRTRRPRPAQWQHGPPFPFRSRISKRISGTRLLHRTTRSISLTDEGARYYRHCKHVLEEMSNVEASLSGSKSAPRGRLRVDADESYVCNLLVPVLPEFFDRYPQIHIDFVHTGHFFDINDTGADVMLRMFTSLPEDTGVIARCIGSTQMVCAASPDYLEEHGTPRTPHDLGLHRCLMFMDSLRVVAGNGYSSAMASASCVTFRMPSPSASDLRASRRPCVVSEYCAICNATSRRNSGAANSVRCSRIGRRPRRAAMSCMASTAGVEQGAGVRRLRSGKVSGDASDRTLLVRAFLVRHRRGSRASSRSSDGSPASARMTCGGVRVGSCFVVLADVGIHLVSRNIRWFPRFAGSRRSEVSRRWQTGRLPRHY